MLFLTIKPALAQNWSKRFEFPILGAGNEGLSIELHEAGFLIYQGGNTGVLSKTGQHIGLLLLDQAGNELNTTNEGVINRNYYCGRPNCMDEKLGFYVMSATCDTLDVTGDGIALFREYDANLNISKYYNHQSTYYYNATSAIFSNTNGYLLSGFTRNTFNETLGAFIIKLDENAEFEWETIIPGKTTPSLTEIYGSNIINAHDGGYILTAAELFLDEYDECVYNNFKRNRILYKFDQFGELEWTKEWDNCYAEGPFNILATSDGNYVLSHGVVIEELAIPQEYVPWRMSLIKIDPDGNEVWNKNYGPLTGISTLRTTIELENGDLVAVGSQWSNPNSNRNAVILKTSSTGDSLWYRTYQWEPDVESVFNDIIEDDEGGFVACGYVLHGEGFTGQDTWVVRMDSLGCVIGDCTVGIEESEVIEKILVYPNPARNHFTLEFPDSMQGNVQVEVYSSTGQQVYTENKNGHSPIQIPCNQWSSGIYIVKAVSKEQVFQVKLVVDG